MQTQQDREREARQQVLKVAEGDYGRDDKGKQYEDTYETGQGRMQPEEEQGPQEVCPHWAANRTRPVFTVSFSHP